MEPLPTVMAIASAHPTPLITARAQWARRLALTNDSNKTRHSSAEHWHCSAEQHIALIQNQLASNGDDQEATSK